MDLAGKTILITGGTGSFGKACLKALLDHYDPKAVRVFSRDELKQSELQAGHREESRLRYLIGDVRDRNRLLAATRGVDVIIHAAALKQVPACEYNPFEAVQTNSCGAENVVAAAIANAVPHTLLLSTDKAVNPVNLYGATKLSAEKIVTQGNAYAADSVARFASVRYGNVVGSRGSVVPIFAEQAARGQLTITDERMTRFWITLPQAVEFVLSCLGMMEGGEVFVPKIPTMRVVDIAHAMAPERRARVHRHPARREAARGAADRGRVAACARIRRSLPDLSRVSDLALDAVRRRIAAARWVPLLERSKPGAAHARGAAGDAARARARILSSFLPYGRQTIEQQDLDAVLDALQDPMITQGPRIDRFERAFADAVGARHAIAFANGTAALHGAAARPGWAPATRC